MLSEFGIINFSKRLTFMVVFVLFCYVGTSSQARRVKVEEGGISLQEALEIAQDGDIIRVEPGRYPAVEIEGKSIILEGAGAEVTTLIGGVTLRNMKSGKISGFKIEPQDKRARDGVGIACQDCSSLTITNNLLIGFYKGIICTNCAADIVIEYNTFINNSDGVRCRGKNSPTIRKNVVIGSSLYGITCGEEGASPVVMENIVTQCSIGVDIFNRACPVIENNIITDCGYGILSGNASPTIRKNSLTNNDISCSGHTSPTIERNTITNGGIVCSLGAPVIKFNDITVGKRASGILCTNSAAVIKWNTIKGEGESYGISCCYSNATIRGNFITGCLIGIRIAVEKCHGNPVELVPDIGTENDPGRNTIQKYFEYAIVNEMDLEVSAVGNYWGSRLGPKENDIVNLNGGSIKYEPYLNSDQSLKLLWAVEKRRKLATKWGSIKQNAQHISNFLKN